MGTDIIYQGVRSAIAMFFVDGARALQPIPPLDPSRGMVSAVFMMMAVVLWVTVEYFDIYFRRLDPTKRRRTKWRREIVLNLVREIMIVLGVASINRGAIGGNSNRRRRRRG